MTTHGNVPPSVELHVLVQPLQNVREEKWRMLLISIRPQVADPGQLRILVLNLILIRS
jgi:anti-anti-sigma regulatory factor